jgi:hypothetical protein
VQGTGHSEADRNIPNPRQYQTGLHVPNTVTVVVVEVLVLALGRNTQRCNLFEEEVPDTSHEACETSGRTRRTRRTRAPTYPSESAPTGYRLQDEIVAFHGLPQHVTFCSRCVISNQRPNSCAEFRHTKVRSSSGCLNHPSLCFGRIAWFRAR